ncbi:4-hydroxybenzoate octaprenyltransferase [Candidatus Pelagibacter sp. FZCC0015]|uniref:4-hydroxybenzoate octaprenyltransferase n=1 Tax=Candidatus Pelagibacter sp. FZCC0015 TaxID=2268451 RepID=UPI0011A7335C|nr:4-hydroxybenzoate octaprenyltransferase [Candidatus Pelagibacter sp. FZCC0015]
MTHLKLFIDLTRLKKPIGFMLLFWPCAWGLTLAYDFSLTLNNYFFYLTLFFLGSVLMRSAGCIVNDILDKEFDAKVFRTKNRPIASGKISIKLAIYYAFILCFLALLVLLNFNIFTIILALGSMPLAFSYPLMKRYTYWPQLFLGITFNYGLLLGWSAVKGQIELAPILFYLGAIFWTLGYDTVYGYQDIKDDEIIGLKSTSIKFKNNAKKFLFLCFSLLIILFVAGGYYMKFNSIYFFLILIPSFHLFFYQIKTFDTNDTNSCLKVFKSNNFFGLIVFLCFLLIKNI